MLSYLAELENLFGPLRLFQFISFRMVMAGATALLIGWGVGPWLIRRLLAFKLHQTFRTADEVGALAERHASKEGTPTMGGLMIFLAVSISALLWAEPNAYVLVSLFVYAGLTLVGFLDDFLKIRKKNSGGLPSHYKLAGQGLTSIAAIFLLLSLESTHLHVSELWVPFVKDPVIACLPLWVIPVFFFLVVGGSSNAINLTDGVDGLAIGCTITSALAYGVMAYLAGRVDYADYLLISHVPGAGELAVVCAALVGGALAFLWFNCYPASVFMGDTGSLALGGLIGTIAFLTHQPLTLLIVGGIFVIELGSVLLQVGSYKLRRKRIFKMAPIHHHFEELGWSESKIVIRFWILSVIFAIAGLSTLKLR